MISAEQVFQSSNPAINPTLNWWAVPNSAITHEFIRWIQLPAQGYEWNTSGWLAPETAKILGEGYSVAVPC